MCFSAAASFVAGGALVVTGVATLKHVKSRNEIPFASLPLIFGIQQIVEGVVWVTFGYPLWNTIFAYIFAFLAYVWWPVGSPLAVMWMEKDVMRKKIIMWFVLIGAAAGGTLLATISTVPINCEVIGNSISYGINPAYPFFISMLYMVAGVASWWMSSHWQLRWFGWMLLATFVIALGISFTTYTSIWCFLAAILSFWIYRFFAKRDENVHLEPKK